MLELEELAALLDTPVSVLKREIEAQKEDADQWQWD
jgi:hypothetical protein